MPESYEDNDSRRNRVVVVTGSGKGVGKIIATEFAKSGYYVMINDLELHRMGCPEEIAKIALFLASEDASYITGV